MKKTDEEILIDIASVAMAALAPNQGGSPKYLAKNAFYIADAMLEEIRKRRPKEGGS